MSNAATDVMSDSTGPGMTLQRRPRLELAIFAVYLLMVLIGAFNHEAWRDEIRAFTISAYVHSKDSLFELTQYEGHPLLWTILLKPFTLLPAQRGLKLAGLFTAIPAAWVLFRMLPLPLWIRTGVLLGYYWLYEYVVLSRSYAIGFMLTTLGLVLWLRKRSPVICAALFGLAANVHILLALTNIPLAVYLFRDQMRAGHKRWARSTMAIAAALLLLGYMTAFGTMTQTHAMKYGIERIETRIKRYLGIKTKKPRRFRAGPHKAPSIASEPATAPELPAVPEVRDSGKASVSPAQPAQPPAEEEEPQLPRIKGKLRQWRDDSLTAMGILRDFKSNLEEAAWILVRISGTGIALAVLLMSPAVAFTYLLPAVVIAVGLSEVVYKYSVWHKGVYTMILLYSLVLCRARTDTDPGRTAWLSRGWLQAINARGVPARIGAISLSVFLAAGIFLGVNAWTQDLRLPFSGAQAAGYYLREQKVPANNILLYDSPLAESGISMAYGMPPLRADPEEAPELLSWPNHPHLTWRPPSENKRFCDGARDLAVRSGSPSALVRLISPMQTPNQPICEGATVAYFPGMREPVQIELFGPATLKGAAGSDAP